MTEFFDGEGDQPAVSIDSTTAPERSGTEWLTMPGQSHFGIVAEKMRALGWAVIPQERSERRLPSIIAGQRIRWSQYQKDAPSLELTERWAELVPGANAAVLLGAVSGNVISLDIDITDVDLSLHIQEIARDVLGLSPFRRSGKYPKIALFYRMEGELPPNRSYAFAESDGSRSEHAIEIQSSGKLMTVWGIHHEAGTHFHWEDARMHEHGPEHAPVITAEQLEEFLAAVEEVRPFYAAAGAGDETSFEYVDADGIDVARIRAPGSGDGWSEDVEGYVDDGRETYLFALASRTVRANPAACVDGRGIEKLKSAVFAEAQRSIRMSGRWSVGYLKSEVSEKVSRLSGQVARGEIQPIVRECTVVPSDELSKLIGSTKSPVSKVGDTFSWLGSSRHALKVGFLPGPDGAAEKLALKIDRSDIHRKVAETISEGLSAFFDEVRNGVATDGIHVIMAPTGSGKTAHALEWIVSDPDTIADDGLPLDQRRGPLLFLMPTYSNIDEVRSRAVAMGLDPDMGDDELEQAAAALGLLFEGDAEIEIGKLRRQARNSPVRTMIYRGKVAAGCQFPEQMAQLMEADIGSSGMCKSTIKNAMGEREETYCPFYTECDAIRQRSEIASSHVVFLARSFLTLTIPEELKRTRGVIVDEAIWDMLAHTNTMPMSALRGRRPAPTLTKAEREAGADEDFMVEQRGVVADIVMEALESHEDPVAQLRKQRPDDALSLVKIAKRVCSSAIQSGQTVRPGMHPQDFADLVQKPKSKHVKSEHRMWSIIEERLEAAIEHELAGSKVKDDGRMQYLNHDDAEPRVRLSWRTVPNWSEAPLLLLDASADRDILERCFKGRKIHTYECENDANIEVIAFPDRSLAVTKLLGRSGQDHLETAKALLVIRRLITAICAAHSNGMVAICMTKPVREMVFAEWVPPRNCDRMHDGATAGMDFAKDHVAEISLGRTELPISIVDGLVAALTYDMDEPEKPIDYLGTGKDSRGKPLKPHRVGRKTMMRDGRYAVSQHQAHERRFARAVQKQAREEAMRQRIGRVRGVYRETPAAVYLIGEALPSDIVLDDIRSYSDLEAGFDILDTARRIDGILSAEMIAKIAPDQWTVAAAEKAIEKLGARVLRNYRRVEYIASGGDVRTAYVPGHRGDWDRDDFVGWAKFLGLKGRILPGEIDGVQPVLPHAARPADKVEQALGSLDERRIAEEDFRRAVVEKAMSTGEYKLARDTSIGRRRAEYRCGDQGERMAETGAIHLMRLLAGIGSKIELAEELVLIEPEIRKAG